MRRNEAREAFCAGMRRLMAASGVTIADLARAPTWRLCAGDLSAQKVIQRLLDPTRWDVHVPIDDLAEWEAVLPGCCQVFFEAYRLPLDAKRRTEPGDAHEGGVNRALGETMGAVGQLAAEVVDAIADGQIDSQEAARIARAGEGVVAKARRVTATTDAMTPAARKAANGVSQKR